MKYLFLASIGIFLLVNTPTVASAQQTQYTLLAPLPLNGGNTTSANATTYIQGLFILVIGIATVLAVLMIIYGGIKYMSTDAFYGKNEAKDTITHAIWGLLLAIGAWLILYTVNPKLVSNNLSIQSQPISVNNNAPVPVGGTATANVLPGYALNPQQVAEDNAIRQQLQNNNPPVNINQLACVSGGTTGCTNVVGLPTNAINGVLSLASSCQSALNTQCAITITGGTEGGHTNHGLGIPVMDLSATNDLTQYLTGQTANPANGTVVVKGGAVYVFEVQGANGRATGNHWHVTFN